jgi:HK97 family phage major capsid protein
MERGLAVEKATVDLENRTATFSFSSEHPVERWFGMEILSHDSGAPDLSRLKNGGSVRDEHEGDQIGVVEDAWIEEKRAWVRVRYSANNPRADVVLKDMADGIRRNVSFRYRILESVLSGADEKDGVRMETWLVTRWEPIHVAHVADPADPNVGLRAAEGVETTFIRESGKEETEMSQEIQTPTVDVDAIRKEGEAKLAAAMTLRDAFDSQAEAIIEKHGHIEGVRDLVKKARSEKWTTDKLGSATLDIIAENRDATKTYKPEAALGMSDKEVKQYDFHRAIRNVLDKKDDNLEGECHREMVKKFGAPKQGDVYIPYDIQKRDLTVASGSGGGFLVGQDRMGFIDLLRNKQALTQLGATRLTGLKGDVYVPKQTGASTFYWVAEGTAITDSNLTFGQLALTPKTGGGLVEISRQLLLQSDPSAQSLTMSDLAKVMALGVDLAALEGSGSSGEPRGLLSTSGVGTVTWNSSTRWTNVLEFESDIATANAEVAGMKWLTTPAVRAVMKGNLKTSAVGGYLMEDNGTMNGYPTIVSNQCKSGYLIFGDWSQMVVGEWGTMELKVVENGTNYKAGAIEVLGFITVDVGVRQPTAFSYASSVA